ncbi:Uncharacterised protein [Vibrio cholerae]|nr:Uncharacterised protein [Vibrio cholerae]
MHAVDAVLFQRFHCLNAAQGLMCFLLGFVVGFTPRCPQRFATIGFLCLCFWQVDDLLTNFDLARFL